MPEKNMYTVTKNKKLRVVLEPSVMVAYFNKIKTTQGGIKMAAQSVGVSERTMRDWFNGSHLPTLEALQLLKSTYNFELPTITKYIDEVEQKRANASLGGFARNKKFGNPGTLSGRKKGGRNAIKTLKARPNYSFLLAKRIRTPRKSTKLAELAGIIIGDGSISNYQIKVTLNRTTDKIYAKYVGKLFKELFDITPAYYERPKENTITVVASSVLAIKFLERNGLIKGDKIKRQIDIPAWILEDNNYLKACIKGLFDTDGCVYLDKHHYKDRVYLSIVIDFTSCSSSLLFSYLLSLKSFGLHPALCAQRSVRLRHQSDVKEFFEKIGTSNPKHKKRYNSFLIARGGVPKWS